MFAITYFTYFYWLLKEIKGIWKDMVYKVLLKIPFSHLSGKQADIFV